MFIYFVLDKLMLLLLLLFAFVVWAIFSVFLFRIFFVLRILNSSTGIALFLCFETSSCGALPPLEVLFYTDRLELHS